MSSRTAAELRPGAADEPRVRWQELTRSECFELLANEHLSRLAVIDDRGPVVFPVNFVLDRHTSGDAALNVANAIEMEPAWSTGRWERTFA